MDTITSSLTSVTALMTNVLGVITGNELLTVIFAAGTFYPLGLKVFRGTKKAALR